MTPPAPMTGSPMNAATRSAPSSAIFSSTARAARAPVSSGVSPGAPMANQYGGMTCSKPGSGRSPTACMASKPPRLAAAIVLP